MCRREVEKMLQSGPVKNRECDSPGLVRFEQSSCRLDFLLALGVKPLQHDVRVANDLDHARRGHCPRADG